MGMMDERLAAITGDLAVPVVAHGVSSSGTKYKRKGM